MTLPADASLPQPRRRMGGLMQFDAAEDSLVERTLDSIDLAWLADVPVSRSLAVPVGAVMGAGWAMGSFAASTGILGLVLVVAGLMTLVHAWHAHHDGADEDGGERGWLHAHVAPAVSVLAQAEITIWAMLGAAALTWWLGYWAPGLPLAAQVAIAAVAAVEIIARILQRDES